MKTLVFGGNIVNEGDIRKASVIIDNGVITEIKEGTDMPRGIYDKTVDASGCFVLPGIIDSHVHFREPGLTDKADIESESRAAAYGGVTSFFDMPNTKPQTTTTEALEDKFKIAESKSHVNYSFFFGATNNNIDTINNVDHHHIPGVKLFMGSSTGNMLVDRTDALRRLFSTCDMPIMAHCEDTSIINANMAVAKAKYGDDPDVIFHPLIRSEEACYRSTALAVGMAEEYGARLHVAHVTTARELQLFGHSDKITCEAVIAHLMFCNEDYRRLGSLIKCNPAIKTRHDRDELRRALADGRIRTVGTDHAPHKLSEKQGGCFRAASGMPMIQFSLVSMLELTDNKVLAIERLVELMCHNPALLFSVRDRGFIRPGYKADLTIVSDKKGPWTVTREIIQSKCGWSPMSGHEYRWRVMQTICNGNVIYDNGHFDNNSRGEAISFR